MQEASEARAHAAVCKVRQLLCARRQLLDALDQQQASTAALGAAVVESERARAAAVESERARAAVVEAERAHTTALGELMHSQRRQYEASLDALLAEVQRVRTDDGDPFVWTSNWQLISKVYLEKHPDLPRTYKLNKNDNKMVREVMKKMVAPEAAS